MLAPSWSPDGKSIIFNYRQDLWMQSLEGGPEIVGLLYRHRSTRLAPPFRPTVVGSPTLPTARPPGNLRPALPIERARAQDLASMEGGFHAGGGRRNLFSGSRRDVDVGSFRRRDRPSRRRFRSRFFNRSHGRDPLTIRTTSQKRTTVSDSRLARRTGPEADYDRDGLDRETAQVTAVDAGLTAAI